MGIIEYIVLSLLISPLFWFAQRSRNRGYRRRTWQDVAQKLGLGESGRVIRGQLHRQQVEARLQRLAGARRNVSVVVASSLPRALDLGLQVELRSPRSWRGVVGAKAPADDLHSYYEVEADELSRALDLLDRPLRKLLLGGLGSKHIALESLHVGDRGMTLEMRLPVWDRRGLEWAIDLCARVASQMWLNTALVPAARSLADCQRTWQRYAERHGMRVSFTPLGLWISLDGIQVAASTVRTAQDSYCLDVRSEFTAPLDLGVLVQPEGTVGLHPIVEEDYELADQHFDETFFVAVADDERIGHVFDATVRRELLALHDRQGPLSLTDHGLIVRVALARDPATVMPLLHRVGAVTRRIEERAHGAELARGPYR